MKTVIVCILLAAACIAMVLALWVHPSATREDHAEVLKFAAIMLAVLGLYMR